MNRARKYFIELYTKSGSDTFLNVSASYHKAYPKSAHPDKNGHRLSKEPEVKTRIDEILKGMASVSCEDITLTAQSILNKWTSKPSVQLKALELIARLHKLLKDNEITSNTTIISSLDSLKARENTQGNKCIERRPPPPPPPV